MLDMHATLEQIPQVVQALQAHLSAHALVCLQGDLGSGKTTFVQYFCKTLSAPPATSPTFSLLHFYKTPKLCIYHYDFYLKGFEELHALGVLENLEQEGVHFIEWGDCYFLSWLKSCGFSPLILSLERSDEICHYKLTHG
ncbi:tRNA (adenosine(37)-N6)-threonylcarbamoyltransferase complex ATPase subunit type 1 TsaE [Helicobacter heilmannii]|uniref:tRNA threonylcarbamoyladenosine biosynthesis protein TsaE n=1 Tax=Helicobacter heilmannii TaxID=35817 RepID=A0A0K2XUJ3_HELHE|nr:tRNA (adenosine(37)-N6)-threonylcarbamoyltransferase complex ATPase subunit type 1 TsaE [Helicobacter heilmannii]CCM12201.1 ATPase YjeE, predicted to have essential role in cell wall biosynthesis [Helicobacter heilmannii ASB1.4]CRF46562.1 TsaE protein, required for threonylcarbamoyladenosine t(6)A37 formation in tRNA [Helicobacter heilmannii]CRF47979.1 TsaE protein, required for threonylcarbamoyladenosine t(6)A37 formation in tRNA [Helicobacter heilmannii]CRF48871.1 TsaE protein, required fo